MKELTLLELDAMPAEDLRTLVKLSYQAHRVWEKRVEIHAQQLESFEQLIKELLMSTAAILSRQQGELRKIMEIASSMVAQVVVAVQEIEGE